MSLVIFGLQNYENLLKQTKKSRILTQLLRLFLVSLANQRFIFFRYVCCVLQILILLNGIGLYFNIE